MFTLKKENVVKQVETEKAAEKLQSKGFTIVEEEMPIVEETAKESKSNEDKNPKKEQSAKKSKKNEETAKDGDDDAPEGNGNDTSGSET